RAPTRRDDHRARARPRAQRGRRGRGARAAARAAPRGRLRRRPGLPARASGAARGDRAAARASCAQTACLSRKPTVKVPWGPADKARTMRLLRKDGPESMTDTLMDQASEAKRTALGTLLIERGYIDQEQLDEALRRSAENGERLGEVIVKLGWASEDDLAKVLAEQ